MKRALCLLAMLAFLPALGWAQTSSSIDPRCTQAGTQACVDWTNGLAIAIGTGAPATWARTPAQKNISATRAARLDAARNLLELIKGINLTASTSVQGAMVASDQVSTSIQGRLNGIRPVEAPHYFSDGSVQVKLEANLREVVPADLYSQSGPPQQIAGPYGSPAGSAISPQTSYTGLIIDARGTGVQPAMSPKIYDPQNREVYGSAYVSREFAVSQGMVGYAKSLEQAAQTDRVKGNPAVVKAVKAEGASKADLVISQSDADALRTLAQQQTFLREARVMIVLD
ncbi:MAG TPA: hypothetical protein VKB51_12780 [bacterium]|nr:hypothetical protein [bacterium]